MKSFFGAALFIGSAVAVTGLMVMGLERVTNKADERQRWNQEQAELCERAGGFPVRRSAGGTLMACEMLCE